MLKSGYFFGALLLHLVVLLMVATWIIFKAPAVQDDTASFVQVSVKPPTPPPTPPAAAGGESLNNFEPTVQSVPPPAVLAVVSTSNPSSFSVQAVKAVIPNLPASVTPPSGSGMAGHNAPGSASGAGSPFGTSETTGPPLFVGHLFDLKQTRSGKPTGMNAGKYHDVVKAFIADNWSPSILNQYYMSTVALNTASIFIPTIDAEDGPKAFGVDKEVQPNMYLIWYKVTAAPPQEGTYHFVGVADDILEVRVNHRTVLEGSDRPVNDQMRKKQAKYQMTNFDPTWEGDADFFVGEGFHVSAGEAVDIDVLIGEEPGGRSNYFLFIQRDESTYEKQSNGSPLLPIFQVDNKPIKPVGKPQSWPPFSATPEPWEAVNKGQ